MTKVIGVRFRTAGKIYFFDPLQFTIKKGDNVIVETARGIEFGTVVSEVREVEDDKVVQPLKPVLRIAGDRDREQEAANKQKEKEAFKVCLEKIQKHGLDMKLIDAEYTFDNNKVLFYFTADGRIDFRELVKDLASVFKTRIELRQIGVRDETKIRGGIGICGRPLCCHSYLSDFIPVSIKMAKEQNLSLNPTKISGVCGRLMCCLKNEEETYEELNRRLPNISDLVTTEDGLRGEVHSVNVLRQLVKVVVEEGDDKEIKEYHVNQLHFRRKHSKKERMDLSPEELKELERLESEEFEEAAEQAGARQPHKERHDRRQDEESDYAAQGRRDRDGGKNRNRRDRNRRDTQNGTEGEENGENRRNCAGSEAAAEARSEQPGGRDERRERRDRDGGRNKNRRDRNRRDNGGRNESAEGSLDNRRERQGHNRQENRENRSFSEGGQNEQSENAHERRNHNRRNRHPRRERQEGEHGGGTES